jgi:xanthine dehydrogenase accessory factor
MPDDTRLIRPLALVKGAGDLATGVALRLKRSGFLVVMTETQLPTAVRRRVAFAEAVYEGHACVEGVEAVRAAPAEVHDALSRGMIPVVIDRDALVRRSLRPLLLVDAIIAKRNLGTRIGHAPVVVALGPGFVAGQDADAVVETKRGHDLGKVLLEGSAAGDTGAPGDIGGFTWQRVVRSPAAGVFREVASIGDLVGTGEVLGYVGSEPVPAPLGGVLRGLLHSGLTVTPGFKLGDVDPRGDASRCSSVSDKARSIAGGVLEAACALSGGVRFEPTPEQTEE